MFNVAIFGESKQYAAHIIRNDNGDVIKIQSVKEHLENVASLAAEFAAPFNSSDIAEACGLFHDIGKYSNAFQKRIWEGKEKIDHSSAGAKEILKNICGLEKKLEEYDVSSYFANDPFGAAGAYCISGHHAGLLEGGSIACVEGSVTGRLSKIVDDYSAYKTEISVGKIPNNPYRIKLSQKQGFTFAIYIRMLFSCLVDADYLDTEFFMSEGSIKRDSANSIDELVSMFDEYIERKKWLGGENGINKARSEILSACIAAGKKEDKGLFSLTVPTGGGKTVSSLGFALHQAKMKKMKRVIYVIPYCSIIDQTVGIFEQILGEENVLAHYSESNYDDGDDNSSLKKLACENWDMPVIVTTAVQFFESLFSNRPSKCRKLHNISDSIIVFDEAQTFPIDFLKPCVGTIAELVENYNSSCVLCTATQPALNGMLKEFFENEKVKELCPALEEYDKEFRRVNFKRIDEPLTDADLAERIGKEKQVLCIVSTRTQTKNVYGQLECEGCYHLSTLLRPKERREIISTIRHRLQKGLECRVVSTSLIEAGVDLDFPKVYRGYAGIDSMIQAAGRCNRENKRSAEESEVVLFDTAEDYKIPSAMERPRSVAISLMDKDEKIDTEEMIRRYFEELYYYEGTNLDRQKIIKSCEDAVSGIKINMNFPFPKIAEEFRMINDDGWTILIPLEEESERIAEKMRSGFARKAEYRKMGEYCINIFDTHFNKIKDSMTVVGRKVAILDDANMYDKETGLKLETETGRYWIY